MSARVGADKRIKILGITIATICWRIDPHEDVPHLSSVPEQYGVLLGERRQGRCPLSLRAAELRESICGSTASPAATSRGEPGVDSPPRRSRVSEINRCQSS